MICRRAVCVLHGRIPRVALLTLAAEPQSATVLAERRWIRWVNAIGQVEFLRATIFRAEHGQHALRSEWRFAEAHTQRVINRVRHRGNGRGERAFTGFFRPKRPLGINALDDDRFNLRRLG